MAKTLTISRTTTPAWWHIPFVSACLGVIAEILHIVLFYGMSRLPIGFALRYSTFTVYKNLFVVAVLLVVFVWTAISYYYQNTKMLVLMYYAWIPLAVIFFLEVLIPR